MPGVDDILYQTQALFNKKIKVKPHGEWLGKRKELNNSDFVN